MTEEELSKMISEFLPYPAEGQHHALKHFAKLVAAAEREECAKVCEVLEYNGYERLPRDPVSARRIRARSAL
jgi:hypothetical protein